MKKRILAIGLSALMALAAVGCGSSKAVEIPALSEADQNVEKTTKSISPSYDADDMAQVAENSSFTLSVKKDGSEIQVKDKKTGKVWSSTADGKGFDFESVNAKWQQKLASPFEIFYTDLQNGYGTIINLSLLEMDFSTTIEGIDNGVRVTYDMENPGIVLAIDYYLTDDGLKVDVPESCIKEDGTYSITSLKLLPYMASASDQSDGYYFYPDGSGAIMEFKDTSHYQEAELALTMYGNIMNYKNTLDVLSIEDPQVMIPVFGADIDNSGLLAIIEKGEESSQIKITPTNSVIGVNSICCDFTYRRSFKDERIAAGATNENASLTYDKDRIPGDRSISYRLLEQGKSTYSDMAVAYRNYLLDKENGLGIEPQVEGDVIPLSLDLFMGIKENGLLYDEFKVVTDFDQSVEVLEKFAENGVENVEVQLEGWTKKGYYQDPVAFPVNSAVGGKNGLKKLTDYASDKNVAVSLQVNLLDADSEAGGFNEREDVIYLGNNTIYSNYNESKFLLSPTASLRLMNGMVKDGKDTGIDGFSFYSLGQYLPYNYYTNDIVTQAQASADYKSIFQQSKDNFGTVTVQGGNSYVLGVADKITDVPSEDSGFQITTNGVPFYQIALHGIVKMSGLAGNLSSDITKESLKWAEYGYMPYFELTHQGSEPLMYTDYSNLYSSTYTDWMERATKIYKEFNEKLSPVWSAHIINHEEVQDDVFAVTYDNGKTVYVNYTDDDVSVNEEVMVDATSFVVK